MHAFSKALLFSSLIICLATPQIASALSIQDIQEYCESMNSGGMSEEDTKAFMDECIAEQRSYLEQEMLSEPYGVLSTNESTYEDSTYEDSTYEDSTYEDSTYEDSAYEDSSYENSTYENAISENSYQDTQYEENCYAKVDEQIQKLLDIDPNSEFDYDQLIDQCFKSQP